MRSPAVAEPSSFPDGEYRSMRRCEMFLTQTSQPRSTPTPTGALTPAESRVAALAGQGLRNTEIAARLHLAPKTVESTLSLVYRKLGVRSRTELARRQLEASTTGDGVGAESEATGR
jgi:DNA-binding NarL/FixJ family response regulator